MAKLRSQQLNPNFTGSFKVSGSFIVTGSLHSTNTVADSGSFSSRVTIVEGNVGGQALNATDTPTFAGLNLTDDTSITGSLSITGDVTARSYIVSSSVSHFTQSFSSGSTAFGDTSDDSHTFIGNITASGNISGSSTSTGSFGTIQIGGHQMYGDTTGIGIGTADPEMIFHVHGTEAVNGYVKISTGRNSGYLKLGGDEAYIESINRTMYLNFSSGMPTAIGNVDNIFWPTAHTDGPKVYLKGPVGIGTQNPSKELTVAGDISGSTSLWIGDNSNYISASNGTIFATGNISGSSTSTGSFGYLNVAGNIGLNEYIHHRGDADTYIQFATDEINFVVGAANMIYLNEGGAGAQADKVTINNDSADVDFQVKGDNDANLIRTDALNDRVGIGTSTPEEKLHVVGDIRATGDILANRYIVSSSVVHLTQSFSSGSTIFGDTIDDTHRFTGSLYMGTGSLETVGNVTASGNISSSYISTGSFGSVQASGSGYNWFAGDTGIGTTSPDMHLHIHGNEAINGYMKISTSRNSQYLKLGGDTPYVESVNGQLWLNWTSAQNITLGQDSLFVYHTNATGGPSVYSKGSFWAKSHITASGNISASYTSTGSFGTLRAVDPAGINITAVGSVSGSSTSTGSFAYTTIKDTFLLPVGTTAQRGTYSGSIRYSSTLSTFEGYDGANWGSLGGVIDVDQDTYITAETSAGADNDEIRFTTAGTLQWTMGTDGSMTGSLGNHVSGSSTSTGSFGELHIDDKISIGTTISDKILTVSDTNNSASLSLIRNDSAIQDGEGIGEIYFGGTEDAGANYYYGAKISVDAEEHWLAGGSDTAAQMSFWTTPIDSSTLTRRMTIKETGYIGIGTDDPSHGLEVYGTDATAGSIRVTNTATSEHGFHIRYAGQETKGGIFVTPSSGEVKMGGVNSSGTYFTTLYANNSERMRIESGGDILFVGTNQKISGSSTSTGSFGRLEIGGGGGITAEELVVTNITASGNISSSATSTGSFGNAELTTIHAHNGNGLKIFDDGGNEAIWVEDGGYVGIGGRANPSYNLDVQGTINSTSHISTTGNIRSNQDQTFLSVGADTDLKIHHRHGTSPERTGTNTNKIEDVTNSGLELVAGTPGIILVGHVTASAGYNISGSSTSTFTGGTSTFTNYGGNVSGSATSTGSFGLVMADLVSGSSTSTGSFGRIEADVIEAKQFIVSSSVTNIVTIDVSGSTEFGDTLDDTHRFTGSVYIQSGSLAGEMHIVTNTDRMFVGRYGGGIPISGSVTASRYATGSDGSIIDIGFTTVDDDGNIVLTTTGDGVHVNDRNYWYNSEHFRVGSNHQYLNYNTSDVRVKGQLVVTTGSYDGEMYIDTGTSGSMGKMFIGKYTGGIPVSGSVTVSRYATGSDGSIVDVGFTTVDEDGNTIFTTTGDGIYVDDNNYWYTTGHFKIGSSTNYLNWDNTGLSVTGPLTASGDIIPSTHNSYDLGSDSARWANIYSADVHLSNDDTEGNEVDGTTGNWTIQEGNDDLFIINRKTGKKFKFLLQEVT